MNNLFAAILANNHNEVKTILASRTGDNPADIDSERGCNGLMLALAQGYHHIAELLMQDPRVDVNARDNRGRTALMYVTPSISYTMVEKLISKGADVNLLDNDNNNVLFYIAYVADCNSQLGMNILRLLVDHGANLKQKNNQEFTPLTTAILQKSTLLFDAMLSSYHEKIDNSPQELALALMVAVYCEDEYMTKTLIKAGADVNHEIQVGETPLRVATRSRLTRLVKILLEAGADPLYAARDGKSAYQISLESADLESLTIQIKHLCINGELTAIQLLDKHFEDHRDPRLFPLIEACSRKCDDYDNTFLNFVIKFHFNHILPIIMQYTDKAHKNRQGQTPAHIAAIHDNKFALELLYNQGWDLDQVDDKNFTPLLYACASEAQASVDYLHALLYKQHSAPEPSVATFLTQYDSQHAEELDVLTELPPLFPEIRLI